MRLAGGMFEEGRRVGVAAAVAAVGLGICYLAAAGAPARMIGLNLAALLVGLAAFATVNGPSWRLDPAGRLMLPALGAVLLATALFGTPVDGASRWATFGPLNLQVSLIVLPAMLVAFARAPGSSGAAGLSLAALALALQPDRAMAGVLVASLMVLALRCRDRAVWITLAAALAGFAATLLRPDTLPAVPFVDRIFFTSFDVHPLAGAAVVGGAILMLLPALTGWRGGEALRSPALVFGAAWGAIILAAALGNYPTPLVGYGGSAIVGYLLSVALLPAQTAASRSGQAAAGTGKEAGDKPLLRAA
ncbi:MAG TPA: hypothetical protein VGW34_16395 [Allosphingosinicella sp.]|nr:hypothetical protein [Allosphingosinicella sp.]